MHKTEPSPLKSRHAAAPGERHRGSFFQPRLTVNQPGDAYEREADRVADQVMRMRDGEAPVVQRTAITPVAGLQRKCAECEQEEKKLQRKETAGTAAGHTAPPIVTDVLRSGGGQPLDGGTRQFMESRFGQDFSQVRVHVGGKAAESAAAIQAKAYTSGRDVVFGQGEYRPETDSGRRLLAHELVHVGQQGATEAVRRQDHAPSPLELPASTVDMPFVTDSRQLGAGDSRTELGFLRSRSFFWREYQRQHAEQLSEVNRQRITALQSNPRAPSPRVDDTWIRFNPQHSAYRGEPITHHHVQQGNTAVGLPESLHRAHSVFHPQRRVVPAGEPLPPLPTRAELQQEVGRHTARGNIRGEGISPANPPQVGADPRAAASVPAAPASSATTGTRAGTTGTPAAPRSGTTATVGVAPRPPAVPDPLQTVQSRQVGIGGGAVLALAGVNFVLNWLNDRAQTQRVQAAFAQLEPALAQSRTEHPSDGILVIVFYRQAISHPDSVIVPGPVFTHIEHYRGRTRSEASRNYAATPSIRPDSPGTRSANQELWIPPLQPVSVAAYRSPFPRRQAAAFARAATLQNVEFQGTFGFDDAGESSIGATSGLQFHILQPPPQIYWGTMRGTLASAEIAIEQAATSSGQRVPVVNLDTTLDVRIGPMRFGGVRAAMVFPANEATQRAFSTAPATGDSSNLLRQFPNVNLLRWVRPENIRLSSG